MNATILQERLTARQQAAVLTTGLALVLYLGIAASIALVLLSLWAVVQLASLTLQAAIECFTTIEATYAAADPLVKFCLLVGISFIVYHACKRLFTRSRR